MNYIADTREEGITIEQVMQSLHSSNEIELISSTNKIGGIFHYPKNTREVKEAEKILIKLLESEVEDVRGTAYCHLALKRLRGENPGLRSHLATSGFKKRPQNKNVVDKSQKRFWV
ncbi:MAG: hypothetical protein ABFQ53_01580 [Patescibacteria group bacterium]